MFKKLISLCLALSLLITCSVPALALQPLSYYTAHSVDELIHWVNTADANDPETWGSWDSFLGAVRKFDQIPVVQSASEGYSLKEILVPIAQDNVQYFFENSNDRFMIYIELPGTEDDPKPSLDERMAEINQDLALSYDVIQYKAASATVNGTEIPVYYCNGGSYLKKGSDETELFAPTAYYDWQGYTVMIQGIGNLYGSKWDHVYFDLFKFDTIDLAQYKWSNPFTDMTENDWFYDEVQYVYEKGLMNGVSDNRFAPQDDVSRAMAITVLYRLAGSPSIKDWLLPAMNPFSDLERGWYYDAVIWGGGRNIIEGYGDSIGNNLFGPDDPVTREQLVTMFWRAQGKPVANAQVLSAYADAAEISPWAEDAFAWAVSTGLIQGKPGKILDPTGTTSRAQLATILMRTNEAN